MKSQPSSPFEIVSCEDAAIAYEAVRIGDCTLFRGMSEIYPWNIGQPDVLTWTYPMPDDQRFGHKLLVATEGMAISFADLIKAGARLFALDPCNGRVVWEKPLTFRPYKNCLVTAENGVHIRGARDSFTHLVIDPQSGETKLQADGVPGGELTVVGNRLLVASRDGLLMSMLDAPGDFESVKPFTGAVASLTTAYGRAWFLYEDPAADLEYRVASFDPVTGDLLQGAPDVSRASVSLTPITQERVAMLPGEGGGVLLYDMSADTPVWQVGVEEQAIGHKIIATERGLFTLIEPVNSRTTIWRLDPATGERLDFPVFSGKRSLHWVEDTLITTGLDGLDAVRGWS